jgi:hypothetical protein
MSPTHGPAAGGYQLTITGILFDTSIAQGKVEISGVICPIISYTATRIACLVPAGSGLDLPVVVTRNVDGRTSNPVYFDYDDTSQPELDFGDAPDPSYPTLLSSDGARSRLVGSLRLGTSIDAEADGQQSENATGDDVDDLDDEDGVTFGTLTPGQTATSSIQSTGSGFVSAWIDFNRDGNWSDDGEQVLTDQVVGAGANHFPISVPASAAAGLTFARTRLSSVSGLSPTGEAPDGEVEDDRVEILSGPSPTPTNTPTPTPTPTRTSTPTPPPTLTPTPTPTPTSTPTSTPTPRLVHIGDLDGSSDNGLLTWRARVGVAVHDGAHAAVAGARVTGSWNRGSSSTSSCVTGANGRCILESGAISNLQSDATLSATQISSAVGTYAAALNHDPDGDSNGNSIRVRR